VLAPGAQGSQDSQSGRASWPEAPAAQLASDTGARGYHLKKSGVPGQTTGNLILFGSDLSCESDVAMPQA